MSAQTSETRQAELLVETSVLAAILFEEPEWEEFTERILGAKCQTTSVNVFETALAITKIATESPTSAHGRVVKLVQRLSVEVVALSPEMIPHAVVARERYGRGRKGLNMGDCLSYAAAKQLGLKLLYKGDDFAATDVNG